jgi:MFS family permease
VTLAVRIQRTYVTLTLGNTLAGSFIWGINTLFLLDAGLTNLEAFAANAFFAGGMVLFEVPTGVVADTWGRRASYLLGTVTLAGATLLYWWMWRVHAPFWAWGAVSMMLGLGFTFFSGAVEAWLVDALAFAEFDGELETVFGRAQIASGIAMLGGSFAGGAIAQATDLGVPFLLRTGVLLLMFVLAFTAMKDLGFTPETNTSSIRAMRAIVRASVDHGWKHRPIRFVMLAAPFASGAGFYAFYAVQPYLLELYGDEAAYTIAGLAAALVAGTQILGGWAGPRIRRLFHKRTSALLVAGLVSAVALLALGLTSTLVFALVAIAVWGLAFAANGFIC